MTTGVISPHILVAYATLAGSTAEVASEIGAVLCEHAATVDVLPVEVVTSVEGYDAVLVGSAIRSASWLPAAQRFVEQHRAALRKVPVAYFTVCITLCEENPENREMVLGYVQPICDLVQPVASALFAGKVDYKRLSFPVRTLAQLMQVPEGDFRDWTLIRTWAERVLLMLETDLETEPPSP